MPGIRDHTRRPRRKTRTTSRFRCRRRPSLTPIAKAAWAALICGPLYLLAATFLHWTISGIEAFAAVAAFVGGFVTLVIRLGDSERDDDDDGAVV